MIRESRHKTNWCKDLYSKEVLPNTRWPRPEKRGEPFLWARADLWRFVKVSSSFRRSAIKAMGQRETVVFPHQTTNQECRPRLLKKRLPKSLIYFAYQFLPIEEKPIIPKLIAKGKRMILFYFAIADLSFILKQVGALMGRAAIFIGGCACLFRSMNVSWQRSRGSPPGSSHAFMALTGKSSKEQKSACAF